MLKEITHEEIIKDLKKRGYNSMDDFIKAYWGLVTENEKAILELLGFKK